MKKLFAFLLALSAVGSVFSADNVIISEFMAKNDSGLLDEDGSREDWIEIFNPGTNAVNLLNWSLTDAAGTPAKWRFPATNIGPGRFLMVWASGKNRRVAGSPLHTSFKLDPDPGEYLGLYRPDLTVASEFTPAYPAQAPDVSFGFGVTATTNALVTAATGAKYLVPSDFSQDLVWTDPSFSDAAWSSGVASIGYNLAAGTDIASAMSNINSSVYLRVPFNVADASTLSSLFLKVRYDDGFVAYLNGHEVARRNAPSDAMAAQVANSTNDWSPEGAQGINGWFYGYYNRGIDTNDNTYTYTTDFNMDDSTWNFGTNWVLGLDDPPYTMIGRTNWMPNGNNNFTIHWPVRRWVSPVSGVVTAQVSFAKAANTGSGATLRVFHNGALLTARTIAAADTTGFTTNIPVAGIELNDTLDFALDPLGTDAQLVDTGDLCSFSAIIWQAANTNAMWNSAATGPSNVAQATTGETFDISSYASFLLTGGNVLSVHGLNASAGDSDFLIAPELLGVTSVLGTNQPVYFLAPSPGAVNGIGRTNLGPLIVDVTHTPREPYSNQVVTVTARALKTFNNVAGLSLRYRVMFGSETNTLMFDDGLHGDGAANDGVFGAAIPANIARQGEMIRYFITSTDTAGATNRSPAFLSANASPQYWGLVVRDLSITSALPVLHWFVSNAGAAATDAGTRCSLYYDGQFLDNVGVTLHGQSSAGFPKKSYNFNLNSGYRLKVNPDYPSLSDFAVLSTWADRGHLRTPLNSETYNRAGTPAHYSFMLRVQQNGTFLNVCNFIEQGNDDYLQRIGYDPDGALYKMYNTFTGAAGNEKKTRKYEPMFDLQAFYNAVNQGDTTARLTWIYDNVNIPAMINFLAVKSVGSDHDCCHKNYYFYRDSNKSGEWFALPWDFDLSYGHVWTSGNGNYFDDTIYTNLFLTVGDNNTFFVNLKNDTALRSMWMRRTRTLADELLQPPGTPPENDLLRSRIDYYANLVRPDAMLDKIKWGGASWTPPVSGPPNATTSNPTNNFEFELTRLKDYYLPGRRTFINLASTASTYAVPSTQPTNIVIQFGAIDYNPASSNQAQEYIELLNTNNFAVDISRWHLMGGVDFTFSPGTIIAAGARIYVSPDVKAFRSRTYGPRGGQRLFVVGPYSGQLSARGEPLALVTPSGQTNRTIVTPPTPSIAQQYLRITELMYHPAPSTSALYTQEDYEYIELKNISTNVTVDLRGVKLADGVEFDFATGAITSLSPGQRCLVVRSNAAFALRYGGGLPVAGAYTGLLENGGERVRLLDASNEEILDFNYNNSWYPMTDGLGFSLVPVSEKQEPDLWSVKAGWRASGQVRGSPNADDPAPVTVAPIVITEVLSASALPDVDAVELYNPTTNDVNIGGWFLSDDFNVPAKYRIPSGTIIPAGGYATFNENQFNAGFAAFAFSSSGEEAYIFSGDAQANLTGYFNGFEFGPGLPGVSFGEYINSQTNRAIVSLAATTLGAPNSGPRVGPIVISEIMYAPVDSPDFEFVELLNISSNAVPLYDPAFPTNRWKLKDAVSFSFSTNTVLAPGAYLVVVPFDPQTNAAVLAAFRSRFNAPGAQIVGPFTGQLDNSGDDVELASPLAPDTNGVVFALQDKVDYQPSLPWDISASGIGASLHRVVLGDFGNDPTNWTAAVPSPGQPKAAGGPPVITQQPQGGLVVENTTISLNVGVQGAPPLAYQWLFNGAAIPGAYASTLVITNAQVGMSGNYSVAIYNGGGAVLSGSAAIDVRSLPKFTTQPLNRTNITGTNVTLTCAVAGTPPITYQWRMNGSNLPGATSNSLTLSNLDLYAHAGFYDVVAVDFIGSVTSSPAALNVSVKPFIITPPVSTTVAQGGTARFRVVAGPDHPFQPLAYRWFTTNGTPPNNTNSVLLITNVQTTTSVRLSVSDPAGQVSITSGIILTMLPDSDGDGIPDVWETANNFNANDPADGVLDTDGDGMSNRDEYMAGTDPRDPASLLRVGFSALGAAMLEFTAQSNISYTIQYRTNLSTAPWQSWSNVPAGLAPRTVPFRAATNDVRFYRVTTPMIE